MSLREFAACIDLIMVLEAILINKGKANTSKNNSVLYANLILNNFHKLRFWQIHELETLGLFA